MALNPEQFHVMMKIVSDPRYNQAKYMQALQPTADLKLAVVAGGLVQHLNRAYGWNLPENGDWPVERTNDIIYDIVCRPDYTLDKFISAIKSGKKM